MKKLVSKTLYRLRLEHRKMKLLHQVNKLIKEATEYQKLCENGTQEDSNNPAG